MKKFQNKYVPTLMNAPMEWHTVAQTLNVLTPKEHTSVNVLEVLLVTQLMVV